MIIEDNSNPVSLIRLDCWTRRASVEAPKIKRPARKDNLFHGLRNQVENLHAIVRRERQIANIEARHAHGSCAPVLLGGEKTSSGKDAGG